MRGAPVTALVLAAAIAGASCGSSARTAQPTTRPAQPTTTAPVVQQSICPSQQQAGMVADFGHFKSVAAANRMIARARKLGFQGLEVQQRRCHDFAVVLRGLKNLRQGHSFQREARRVGLRVTLDCRSQPMQGGLVAVFGHRRTARAARRLAARAARSGFRGLQVVQDRCTDWEVALYGLRTAQERRAFAREARSAGFHVKFEAG